MNKYNYKEKGSNSDLHKIPPTHLKHLLKSKRLCDDYV